MLEITVYLFAMGNFPQPVPEDLSFGRLAGTCNRF